MKRVTTFLLFAATLLSAITFAPESQAADFARIQATLILGSNHGSGVDAELQRYERHLKKFFQFDSFSQQGRGQKNLALPGSSTIDLGGGHTLSINATDAGNGKLRIATKWNKDGRVLINTTVVGAPNQPTVLAGPSQGDGKLILLLVAN